MHKSHGARLLVAGLLVLLAVIPATSAAAQPSSPPLNPPLPDTATDVHCQTGGNGTVCHYTFARDFGPRPYFDAGVTCAGGFTILSAGTIAPIRATAFYDAAGQLVRERSHYSFTGTLWNAETGKSLPYDGHANRFDDYIANTRTFTGLLSRIHAPEQDIVVVNAGLRLFEFDTEEVNERGARELDAVLCALLA